MDGAKIDESLLKRVEDMSSVAGSGQTTISNTNNDGWLLSQNVYSIVSSVVEIILSAGLGGIVW